MAMPAAARFRHAVRKINCIKHQYDRKLMAFRHGASLRYKICGRKIKPIFPALPSMPKPLSRRAKLVLFPATFSIVAQAGKTEDDYAVYASYRPHTGGCFVGTLKVVRLTDSRLLYPFDGAEQIGPFFTKDEAREAAVIRGNEIVRGDLQRPEL